MRLKIRFETYKQNFEKVWSVPTEQIFFSAKHCRNIFGQRPKAYDGVKRNDLWRILSTHGVSSGFIQVLRCLFRSSSVCVRRNGTYTDWFDIRRGVREGCIASPWLLNLFMDSCLQDLKEYECGLRIDELSVKCLLYANNQVILAPSACGLQEMLNKMNDSV
ncbi:Retrovirus-related Pol polyprotein from type-2 retrotransposable element R2DM; Endonuclease [Eumeta japonica]|uniref:Retrovirus-related Pol polyprotein from type-2 retrotransposable element R2DM Endonuclease n=1 Tax=Eumeta variegata TaxID=151549 RepID=A0A4C1WEM1_EUMVA|nr:Retrovirus-related Pol polyprotein from type-2 retrotransposable element R2DM; Endonuclease [Eumeta japonica]